MLRGICHRCWREGELLDVWPISRSCFRKLHDMELVTSQFDNPDSFQYPTYPRFIKHLRYPKESIILKRLILREGCAPHIVLNFLPIHQHYDLTGRLGWAERKISELDLAINVMALACPPTKKYGEIPSVKLAGGSVISEDIWTWHCFFAAKFIEPIPYNGGSINLQEIRDWMMKMNSARKGEFPIGKN